jgi:hypothetical protein
MQKLRWFTLSTALALFAVMAVQVDAQQGRPQGSRGPGGPGAVVFQAVDFRVAAGAANSVCCESTRSRKSWSCSTNNLPTSKS